MEYAVATYPGVTTSNNYSGKHRDRAMSKGIGFIPLGDRHRAITEYGEDILEERDSVDISSSRRR
jgi:hypothetical protein